ncbi:MAG: hypothetical protein JNJ83_20945 [Verrucomicrobiaceae bacterium]|nr:hypothetical protein [Verrucomicrobiaceae bacterium]
MKVYLTDDRIIKAYSEFSTLAKSQDLAIFHDKNDLWIATATKVTGTTLLTTGRKRSLGASGRQAPGRCGA